MKKSKTPEKDKFMKWWNEAKANGLIGINITPSENCGGAAEEEIYAELNRMHEAPTIAETPDFF